MNPHTSPTELRPLTAAQSEDLLLTCSKALLSGIASSILVLRSSGRIAFANEAAEAMLGRSSSELAGLELSTIFTEDPELRQPSIDLASSSKRGRLQVDEATELPVRIDVRSLQSFASNLWGSIVTIEDLSDLLQMDEFVKQMLRCDTLTGLPKEDTLAAAMESALLHLHTTGRSFALLELNLDQFRRIKESLGHDAASGALREVAARLVKAVHKGDIVSRNTTDAFTILLTNCTSEQDAHDRADAVLHAFREPFRFGSYGTYVTASIGMSYSRPGTVSASSFSTEAELALRRCKAMGGNRVVCFDPSMADWHSYAVQMESQMQTALLNKEFYVVYQPQVCCQTGRLIGVESLLRWNSPTSGLVMPATFIPAAEESGLIVQLGEWCLRAACEEIVAMQKHLGYPIRLAVNVSPKQIYSSRFKDFVHQTLQETGLDPEMLELEITEGLLISHEDEAVKAINSVQELGISVAMDDFGMGFSNLSYINRFKIDRLKIDRSFIMRCPEDHNSRMITTSLVFLAKSLGIEVVAEGVETQEQASLLAELRCDLAQGYLYSRPTTAAEIITLAAKMEQFADKPALEGVFSLAAAADTPAVDVQNRPVPSPVAPAENIAAMAALKAEERSYQEAEASAQQQGSASTSTASQAPSEPAKKADEPSASVAASVEASQPTTYNTQTTLLPSADTQQQAGERKPVASDHRKQAHDADAALEPREPLCRPTRPQRLPGAMRIRWSTVPDGEPV